ncbi:MAG: SDR family oxidoreductase [Bacteroidales bacterium]|nr:SDR family oxidoreductase [Bacteroidales bacterium]MBS3774605.1 SDR family oxidoreductase [Bacteroidales bacterium]
MKTFLIIGASSGIGKKLAHLGIDAGHEIFGTYYKNPEAEASSGIDYHYLNVLDEEPDFDYLPDNLDGLVYCPGSLNLKPFHRLKPGQFTEDFNLQVVGAIKAIQALLPRLKNGYGGSVVLFSTVAVQMGFNFHTQIAASKGAIEGLTRSLAAELAPKIRVNCIAPSLTNTPLASRLLGNDEKIEANANRHPLKRIGEADDIAAAAEFLLSGKSSWITGQVLHVDGGMSSLKV